MQAHRVCSARHGLFDGAKTSSVVSFDVERLHPLDLGALLDQQGIAVRAGYHCAQPLIGELGLPGTVRLLLAFTITAKMSIN